MGKKGNYQGPVRTCKLCGCKAPKDVLCRFVWRDRRPVLDVNKHMVGRGAYCCDQEKCLNGFLGREKKWKIAFKL
jgi:uncharacterized protein